MSNYTKLASIRPTVLASSASRYGRPDFTPNRRTSLTLVLSDCQFGFKVGNKDVLFSATNNVDGTVSLTNPAGFLSLTVAGSEVVRLASKASLDIDELFITHEELLELHEEPVTFAAPTETDYSDFADFASATLGSYYAPTDAPTDADDLANFFCSLPTTTTQAPHKPVLTEAEADALAEALSPTVAKPAEVATKPAEARSRLSAKYAARITRKSANYRGRFPTSA